MSQEVNWQRILNIHKLNKVLLSLIILNESFVFTKNKTSACDVSLHNQKEKKIIQQKFLASVPRQLCTAKRTLLREFICKNETA